ncbi:GNAT family N-acetyltransferase [Thalassospira lucentensis]|uniref:GNAT family N-acetyltransferase n=1 Tax=Thalassospira lucentensis TaxID=168935 RepID=UPI00142E6133|nr:GNAT family N-acetyltransferase [Thalassospira lucentensis]NIZ02518.1 N-acetyltransferase [Thalassospira lucentensis]
MDIRAMTSSDGNGVVDIYRRGLQSGHASFQENAGHWSDWDQGHLDICRLVASEPDGQICGWAGLSGVSGRCVYQGVAEISVYVDPDCHGQGVGSMLLRRLIAESEKHGFWSLEAGIFPENQASIALHEKHGFELVGRKRRLGHMGYGPMAGQWRDVMLFQRRSEIVGID